MINAGVIGVGYWGPNIIRNFYAHPETSVLMCSELRQDRLDYVSANYPTIKTTLDYKDILTNEDIDLVSICTPVFSHFKIAKDAITAGKHVLIAKPMTSTSAEAEELISLAKKNNVRIFVDHTFLFTGSVKKIKEVVSSGELGDIYYFDSVRINLGLFQHDINVVWDLAPHDISIMSHVLGKEPESVVATGADHFKNGLEDVAYLTIYYPNNLIAHIHVNWLSPAKVRKTLITGSKKMIVWDDNNPSEKIRLYDKGVDVVKTPDDVYKMLVQYRTGDMYCPKINPNEALKDEVSHIVDCIENNKESISDGNTGLSVVRILEAANESIKNRGKEVIL